MAEPSYYRVTGVALDDVLNIRSAPSASSADIGDIAADARGIEVTGFDEAKRWARVSAGEHDGWVSANFLVPDAVETIGQTSVPDGLICLGTEPFWSLELSESTARYRHLSDADISVPFASAVVAEGRIGSPALITYASIDSTFSATVTGALCSDGMSDRTYGWSATVLVTLSGSQRFFEGCCTAQNKP